MQQEYFSFEQKKASGKSSCLGDSPLANPEHLMDKAGNEKKTYLKQFEYVIAIEKFGSITQAAEFLDVAQPSLSRYLKKIESDLGTELFDRTTIPIRLTTAGEQYIKTGRDMLNAAYQMEKRLSEIKKSDAVTIRVGISPSRSAYLLPRVLAEFMKDADYANTNISIVERDVERLNLMLQRGDLDLVFSHKSDFTDAFASVKLFDEEIYLAVSSQQYCGTDVAYYLKNYPIVTLPSDTRTGKMMSSLLEQNSITPHSIINCTTIETALAMVKANLGVTIVPSYIANNEYLSNLKYLSLSQALLPNAINTFCLFYRKGQYLSKGEKRFVQLTKEILQ